ncbi:MAG: energy-coupling factor transporter ATPase [Firmicutes bacterium]|nr:energy-coupling factor transporter ATPase [Bacillota bacterium]
MIEIKDLHYSYSKQEEPTLKGLDLEIRPGEWLAVVGRNGSGKSTLARCLNGLFLPDSGQVLVDGMDTRDEDQIYSVRERVAFVFQNPDNQLVATSVEDDVAFGLENMGLPREEITRRVEGALDTMRLTDKRDKAPHLLSGGEKQRVAIAGAIAMASTYLVLDEPTAMLDPLMRQEVIDSLIRLHQEQGLAIIYVTNIMEEVLLAQRVILLDQGRVDRDCTPAELFSDPDYLAAEGLDVPQISHLAARLAAAGYDSLRGALDVGELAERLTQL